MTYTFGVRLLRVWMNIYVTYLCYVQLQDVWPILHHPYVRTYTPSSTNNPSSSVYNAVNREAKASFFGAISMAFWSSLHLHFTVHWLHGSAISYARMYVLTHTSRACPAWFHTHYNWGYVPWGYYNCLSCYAWFLHIFWLHMHTHRVATLAAAATTFYALRKESVVVLSLYSK